MRKLISALTFTLILLNSLLAFAVTQALTEEELLEQADLVVYAEVTSVTCDSSRRDNIANVDTYNHTATFTISEVLKGDAPESLMISFVITESRNIEDINISCGWVESYNQGQKGKFHFRLIDDTYALMTWDSFIADEDSAPQELSRESCELPPLEEMAGEMMEETAGEVAGEMMEEMAGEMTNAGIDQEDEGCDQAQGQSTATYLLVILMGLVFIRLRNIMNQSTSKELN